VVNLGVPGIVSGSGATRELCTSIIIIRAHPTVSPDRGCPVVQPPSSFEAVFNLEFARLVRSLAVSGDHAAAADAVQDAFMEAHRRWAYVSELDDPAGWIRRVAINRLSNHRRNLLRRRRILSAVRIVDTCTLSERDIDLQRAIRRLPPRQRMALCLHHLAGYSIAEVAMMLEVAEGTVKSALFDARTKLRDQLTVDDDVR
jgi:RNA polymerase sigma-70 factor (ECF subfamily)